MRTDGALFCGGKDCPQAFPGQDTTSPREPCPLCGSMSRLWKHEPFNVTVAHSTSLGLRAMASGKSRNKWFYKGYFGPDWSDRLRRYVNKASFFDRREDRRYEHIVDPETGQVIHHTDHPLTEHKDRGSARFKAENPSSEEPPA